MREGLCVCVLVRLVRWREGAARKEKHACRRSQINNKKVGQAM